MVKLKNSNSDKIQILNCDETQKLKLWWNSKTQVMMKLKNSNCDETPKTKTKMTLKNLSCHET